HDRRDDHDGRSKERCKDDADNRNGHQRAQIFIITVAAVVAAADMSGPMIGIDRYSEPTFQFSRDLRFDRVVAVGSRGDRGGRRGNYRARPGRGSGSRRLRRSRQGRRWSLGEAAQSQRNRAKAEKKRCFHRYPFAVRCDGQTFWIQKLGGRLARRAVHLRQGYGGRSNLRLERSAKRRLERVTRLELATSSLARRCSTTELHPHLERVGIMSTASAHARFLCCVTLPKGSRRQILFFESKSGLRCISLQKDTYDNNASY